MRKGVGVDYFFAGIKYAVAVKIDPCAQILVAVNRVEHSNRHFCGAADLACGAACKCDAVFIVVPVVVIAESVGRVLRAAFAVDSAADLNTGDNCVARIAVARRCIAVIIFDDDRSDCKLVIFGLA